MNNFYYYYYYFHCSYTTILTAGSQVCIFCGALIKQIIKFSLLKKSSHSLKIITFIKSFRRTATADNILPKKTERKSITCLEILPH